MSPASSTGTRGGSKGLRKAKYLWNIVEIYPCFLCRMFGQVFARDAAGQGGLPFCVLIPEGGTSNRLLICGGTCGSGGFLSFLFSSWGLFLA